MPFDLSTQPEFTKSATQRLIRAITLQEAAEAIARETVISRPLDLRPRKQRSIRARLLGVVHGRMGGSVKWQ